MAEDKSGKKQIRASAEEKAKVATFEAKANEAEWVGFNQSSGSTGKPKLQIYRNTVWSCAMKPSLAGAAGMLGFCELVKLAKQALTDNRIAGQVRSHRKYFFLTGCQALQNTEKSIIVYDRQRAKYS